MYMSTRLKVQMKTEKHKRNDNEVKILHIKYQITNERKNQLT